MPNRFRLSALYSLGIVVMIVQTPGNGVATGTTLSGAVEGPAFVVKTDGDWEPVGSGQLRWFGFLIYEATLWAPEGDFRPGERPYALAIDYRRHISGSKLTQTTIDEFQRFGISSERIHRWEKHLMQLFPDVEPGDQIIGVAGEEGITTFYFNQQAVGQMDDPDFTSAFFAIWLSENSRTPALRASLTGKRN